MVLFKSDFRKDILIVLIASVILGTGLVLIGGYLTDNYFANMVSGVIGEYGEYDLLLMLSSDKETIAIKEIEGIVAETLPGAVIKTGPRVAGSSNYLLKLPPKFKNEETYTNLGKYFEDIPGIMSKTIMTEPRLSIRGFRGETRPVLRSLIEGIAGIAFLYPTSDGLDIIIEKPELLPEVKKKVADLLNQYSLLEIRYPLNQHPENLPELQREVAQVVRGEVTDLIDVTSNNETERVSLLTSLRQMKTFLVSYATKVIIEQSSVNLAISTGSRLIAWNQQGDLIELEVIADSETELVALIQQGDLGNYSGLIDIYQKNRDGSTGIFLGKGKVNNPRRELAAALDKLNEIAPSLNGFLLQSEQLLAYSGKIGEDLAGINQGLSKLEESSAKLGQSLQEWEQEGLSGFLSELLLILDGIKANIGDITDIQRDLITTSNQLKEGAGLIEEKIIYVPRNNIMYQQLNDLKNLFLQLASGLDNNYDLVAERLQDMDPVLNSIEGWQEKINSLLRVEDTLNSSANWQEIDGIIAEIEQTAEIVDTGQLEEGLNSIQAILSELNTTQLPVIIDQLSYIQHSLPEMAESEIVETINLIDSYIAGQVIPGDQIQLLIKGKYNSEKVIEQIKTVIKNPAVSYLPPMDAGYIQPNTRGEIFNVLSQVRAVISTIVAFIFTLLVLILDQSLVISVIRLNQGNGYIYGFLSGGLIFSLICFLSQTNFAYLNLKTEFLIGGGLGLIIALLAKMLNPVNSEEWDAGKALGFSPAEIMHEIIIPAGKPGLLYLLNYPKVIFK